MSVQLNKRIIIKNPDGTYSYLYKDGEVDSILIKEEKHKQDIKQTLSYTNNLTVSDDELQYLLDNSDNFDFHMLINQLLEIFKSYRTLFIIFLILETILSTALTINSFSNKQSMLRLITEVYETITIDQASYIYNSALYCFMLINLVYYPLGYYSILVKNIKYLKYFSIISISSAFTCVFIIYINISFLFVFIMRIIAYGFCRFIVNLLISMILLPIKYSTRGGVDVRVEREYQTI